MQWVLLWLARMTYHFNPKNRPTLCAYCKRPAGPFLKEDGEHWLGACCMAHLKKIGEGERLPNKAQLNDLGIEYSIAQTKDLYTKLAIEEDQKPLHKWERDKRKKIFTNIVREYLNWANVQAELDDERAANGFNKVPEKRRSL